MLRLIAVVAALLGSAGYTDPAGDAPGTPDVTAVAVSDSDGVFRFTVTLASLPAASQNAASVFLDTDRLDYTGDSYGAEYLLQWAEETTPGDPSVAWGISRYDAAKRTWNALPPTPTMSFVRNGTVLTWTVGAADLGGVTSFRFLVSAQSAATYTSPIAYDVAPDSGKWSYPDVPEPTTPPPPTVVAPTIAKPKVTRRHPLRLRYRITGADRAACSAKAGSRVLSCRAVLNESTVAVSVPAAQGRVTVRITVGGDGGSTARTDVVR